MIKLDLSFIRAFSPSEQLVLLHLLLHADDNGVVEFSDRGISRSTQIPYQQVRTIHRKWLEDGTLTNAHSNAAANAKSCFVTICDYDSYNEINIISNAVTNAVTNALKDKEKRKEKEVSPPSTPTSTEKEIEELKKENERLKKELANASKKKGELDLSIVDPEYLDVVNLWLKYKKERGETYKPTGFEQMYKKLIKLSGNNPLKAKKIVEESMSNNYSGFFPLKVDSLPLGFIQKDEGDDKYEKAETW